MIKDVVLLGDQIINIGPWDYKRQQVLVSPAEYDDEGKITKEAEYEEQTMNPLPEGATIEEREIEVAPDDGLIVKGSAQPTSDELLGQELAQIKLRSMQQQELLSNMGAELAAARLEIISLKGENGS